MALTFTPPVEPNAGGAELEEVPRVLTARFGDGHLQRAGDGLNAIPQVWNLEWGKLSNVDANTIRDFFVQHAGYIHFLWTPPQQAAPLKFICKRWRRRNQGATMDGAGHESITAEFTQVFDL